MTIVKKHKQPAKLSFKNFLVIKNKVVIIPKAHAKPAKQSVERLLPKILYPSFEPIILE